MRFFLISALLFIACGTRATEQSRVPASLIEVPASIEAILIADTESATLRRFENNGHGIVQVDSRYMSIGRNGVGKQRAWDRKTPLGIYFITEELDTRRLHDKYGDKAFVLDYPNAWDRYLKRTGDGIWLHGVDRRDPDRPPRDTDGCLSLPNEDIVTLAASLEALVTPVVVTRNLQWSTADEVEAQRRALRSALARWQRSLADNNLQDYEALYADNFRARGLSRDDWLAWRSKVFAARKPMTVQLEDVLLLADPEEPGLYLSRFTQVLAGGDGRVVTQKRLYWRSNDDGELRIVTEDNG